MDPRALKLIDLLKLEPYPEGGHFGEVYQSNIRIHLPDKQVERRALTTIYYLLTSGEYDSWHRVSGDEVWDFYEGAPLELFWIEPGAEDVSRRLIGQVSRSSRPVAVVPGGCWQMARSAGEYTLVGCTVGPGFEYEDYQLLRDFPEEAEDIRRRFSELAKYL